MPFVCIAFIVLHRNMFEKIRWSIVHVPCGRVRSGLPRNGIGASSLVCIAEGIVCLLRENSRNFHLKIASLRRNKNHYRRWLLICFDIFTPNLGEDEPILTTIFQMGWWETTNKIIFKTFMFWVQTVDFQGYTVYSWGVRGWGRSQNCWWRRSNKSGWYGRFSGRYLTLKNSFRHTTNSKSKNWCCGI